MRYCIRVLICLVISIGSIKPILSQKIDLLAGDGLKNWVRADGQPIATTQWELKDGVLHLSGAGGGDIFLRNWVGNFELSFEWRIAESGNSGVKYRVQKYGDNWLGCEYQLQDDGTAPVSKHSTAALYDVFAPTNGQRPRPAGEWNSSRIVVIGNQIQHWLNGVLVVYATTDSWEWTSRVCNSKFREHCGWGQNTSGRLMLQDHGSEVWFRELHLTCFSSTQKTACYGDWVETSVQSRCHSFVHAVTEEQRALGERTFFRFRRRSSQGR